jgi:hypothetical protein
MLILPQLFSVFTDKKLWKIRCRSKQSKALVFGDLTAVRVKCPVKERPSL